MLKKILTVTTAIILTSNLAFAASFSGKVIANDGEKVTLKVEKEAPAWLKKGAVVSALGGKPSVVEVKGKDVVLKFGKAKAAKIKTDTNLTINEVKAGGGEQMQGC